MAAPMVKKCRGLYTASNRYDVPEGALVQANNILIVKDGVIQPRWSLNTDSTSMATGNVSHWHRAAELNGTLFFAGRDTSASTLRIGYGSPGSSFAGVTAFSQTEDFPDTAANFTASTTPWFDVEFLKLGNLLYANTFRGLLRIESSSTQRLAGSYPCAVSCFPRPLSVGLSKANGVAVVDATTAVQHGYVVGMTITITSAGDANFTAGTYTVLSVPSSTTFTYNDGNNNTSGSTETLASQTVSATQFVGSSGFITTNERVAYRACLTEYDTNGNEYVGEVSGRVVVTNASPFIGTAATKNVQLAILFPPALLAANTKVELYRSRTVASAEPSDEMGLVFSKFLTPLDVSRGYTWITDINPDSQIRKALYTNETQDGFKQNDIRPAGCKTVAVWDKRVVQANTFDFPRINMQLLSVDATAGGLAAGDRFTFSPDEDGGGYLAATAGTGATSLGIFSIFTGGTASVDVKHTVLALIDAINWRGGSSASVLAPLSPHYAVYTSQPEDWPGSFSILRTGADQYEASSTTAKKRIVYSGNATTTSNRNSFAPKLGHYIISNSSVRTSNVMVVTTAANHAFEVGEYVIVYSNFTTLTQETVTGTAVEGQITAVTSNTLTFANTGSDGSTVAGGVVTLRYNPVFQSNRQKNQVRVSKPGQPEGFPAFNTVSVGAPNANILKCVPCKDSLMVFKEDGLFRVQASGAYGEQLSAELVDPNAILWAKDTAVSINGAIMAWLTKGVAIINESGVAKYVSTNRIENKLKPTGGSGLEPYQLQSLPFTRRAVAYVDEQNGLYELRICMATSPSAPYASTVNLIYNIFNDTWVEDDLAVVGEVFYQGLRYIQQSTTHYYQNTNNVVGSVLNSTAALSFSSFNSSASTVAFTYAGPAPAVGAAIYNEDTFSLYYVLSASGGSGVAYVPGLTAAPSVPGVQVWYDPVVSTIEWAPITFNAENQLKMHREVQAMFGVSSVMAVESVTSSDLVSATETVVNKLGAVDPLSATNVEGYKPRTQRFAIPQQHRVAQQLNFKMVIRCAYGAWTILGIGVDGKLIGPRVAR